jgi:uncharacterized protein YgfB (UPF0149 family)
MLQVTFDEISRVLEGYSSSVPAAEAHGCLCGALCTTAHYPIERWLEEVVPEEGAPGDGGNGSQDIDAPAVRLLFSDTLDALRSDQMDFELLLPDDDRPLEQRATALSQWCQGFLYGFGTGAPVKADELPANVDEVLRDLTHIGRASVDAGEQGEAEEEAYTQIVEYVRVGVQLIHDELIDLRAAEGGALPADEEMSDDDGDFDVGDELGDDRPDPSRLN